MSLGWGGAARALGESHCRARDRWAELEGPGVVSARASLATCEVGAAESRGRESAGSGWLRMERAAPLRPRPDLTLGRPADFRAHPCVLCGHSGDSAGAEVVHTVREVPAHSTRSGTSVSCLLILSLDLTAWVCVVADMSG